MITFKELLSGHLISEIPINHQHNLEELLKRINVVRTAWGKPMIVTSGHRSLQDHLRIYSQIASKKGIDFDANKVPMQSGHLSGLCCDISDPEGELREWVLNNLQLMKTIGLWIEDFRYCNGWVHFGTKPPKSGKRIFVPYTSPPPHPELWTGIYNKEND